MPTPTSPIAPNPDLALWIAGLGFFSSLLVVFINSLVTLKSKNKDIQLKKDEQAYGYKMEYYKRKLNAGEKAVGKLNLTLTMILTLKNVFQTALDFENPDALNFKFSLFEKIRDKYHESNYEKEDAYFAYFSPEDNYGDPNHIITRIDRAIDEITDMNNNLDTQMKIYNEETDEMQKDSALEIAEGLFESIKIKMQNFIVLSNEARNEITTLREKIRNQIEVLTFEK
jgi:hypothetical protein